MAVDNAENTKTNMWWWLRSTVIYWIVNQIQQSVLLGYIKLYISDLHSLVAGSIHYKSDDMI